MTQMDYPRHPRVNSEGLDIYGENEPTPSREGRSTAIAEGAATHSNLMQMTESRTTTHSYHSTLLYSTRYTSVQCSTAKYTYCTARYTTLQ